MAKTIITTRRLTLRSPREGDLDALHERVFSEADVMRHAFGGLPFSEARSAEFYAQAFDHEASGRKLGVLVETATEQVIGFSGLMACKALEVDDYEIGFVLAKPAWKKGYATEIGLGQLEYGFSVVGCSRLLAQVSPENSRSIAALERIGMLRHKTIESEGRGTRHIYMAYALHNSSLNTESDSSSRLA